MLLLKSHKIIVLIFKYTFVLFFVLLINYTVLSQDVIYSQNSIFTHFRNPALIGLFDGKFKLITDFRTQYFTVSSEDKFNSLNLSFDSRFNIVRNDFLNIGLVLNKESLAFNKIVKNRGLINFSYSKQLNYNSYSKLADFLIAGFQLGFSQFSYGMNSYTFGIQFDKNSQLFNSEIPSGEQYSHDKLIPEFNLGLLWYHLIHENNYYIGISAFHINQPDISFDSNIRRKYLQRLSILIGSKHIISKNIALLTSFDFNIQGSNINIRPGSHLKVSLEDSNSFIVGTVFSLNNQIGGIGFSDLILNTGYEFSNFGIGFSYDINLASVKAITGLNGAFEIAAYYIVGKSPKRYRLTCPTF